MSAPNDSVISNYCMKSRSFRSSILRLISVSDRQASDERFLEAIGVSLPMIWKARAIVPWAEYQGVGLLKSLVATGMDHTEAFNRTRDFWESR